MNRGFYLVLFMTAVNVGAFALPSPLIYGADLLNGVLVYLSWRNWKPVKPPFNIIVIIWIALAVYIAFLAVNSDYVKGASTLLFSLRELYPFGLMIYIVALVDEEKLDSYIKFLHLVCFSGVVLALAQSLKGTEGLFGDETFYHRGHSGGQNYMINNYLARVVLPTMYIIQIMFLYLVYQMILDRTQLVHKILLVLYAIIILIGFSRSNWSGLIICIVLALLITLTIRKEKFQRAVSWILLTIFVLTVVFTVVDTPVIKTIRESLTERVDEMFYDLEKKDGNLGSRLSTIEIGMRMFESSPWTGIDLNLIPLYEYYQMSDVGYLYALLTMGLIGLVLLGLWYLVTIFISYRYIMVSARKQDYQGVIISMLLLSNILFFIMIQQTNQFTFSTACLSITTGLFIVKFRSS